MTARSPAPAWTLALACCLLAACAGTSDDEAGPPRSLAVPLPHEPGALATVRALPAHGRAGPGDAPFDVTLRTDITDAGHPRRFGMLALETSFRRAPIEAYPCSSCHVPGWPGVAGGERLEDAHGDIQPVHPAETGATCATCHMTARVDQLALATGETASLDQPYRLCAQCHAPQLAAWAGGGHGKRLDGWYGRRVVMNCTDCHDPHRPALEQRVPFPGPHLPRNGVR
jgi:RNase P subunit RPR2